ncbi:MAG: hypothetical protein ACK4NX_00345 [Candidatus Paceibacteria bacterium]
MRNYAKTGGKRGKPAYRTPSRFIYKKVIEKRKLVPRTWDLAKRLEHKRIKDKKG